jgi:hypothetical protein
MMKTLNILFVTALLSSSLVSCAGPAFMPHSAYTPRPAPVFGTLAPTATATLAMPMSARFAHLRPGPGTVASLARSVSVAPRLSGAFTGSDYQPHLAREYRNGWQAGAYDAAWGAGRDYRRAYAVQGTGWESYFQEGYGDGYDGRPMAH